MRDFDHERMEVYRRAISFVKAANVVRSQLPPGRAALSDQLDRAAVSIALNVAEGAGEFSRREKARFYRIARRSATECAAVFDVIHTLALASEPDIASGKEDLRAIVAMLIALAKHLDENPDRRAN